MRRSLLIVIGTLSLSLLARADVAPANECASTMSTGATCTNMLDGGAGTCQESTCSSLIYLADGGRSSGTSPCLLCLPGAASTTSSSSSGGGCSTGGLVSVVGPLGLALLVPLFVRRRKAR